MPQHGEIEQLAAYLRMLKDRTGRSFDALGRRAGVSGSTLHRYCAGSSVPTSFDSLFAFARVCGASREEMRELQRLWALADARREAVRAVPAPAPGAPDGGGPDGAEGGPDGAGDAAAGAVTGATTVPAGVGGADMTDRTDRAGAAGVTDRTDRAGTADVTDRTDRTGVAGVTDRAGAADGPTAGGRPRRRLLVAAGVIVILLAGMTWAAVGLRPRAGVAQPDGRLLFSPGCQQVVSMGQHDQCVLEVQNLLKDAGARLAVDGDFGPETLKRVTAFQVLAGLPPKGVVDDATKQALYDRRVSMETWPPARVEQRIREVFVEEPERAVAVADCQSKLDPLWVLPNTNGTRNWGVFQISDTRLSQFRATPLMAFDPEWNIQAAYQLWKLRPDFADWSHCVRGVRVPSSRPSSN
jgi:hypothetical protein